MVIRALGALVPAAALAGCLAVGSSASSASKSSSKVAEFTATGLLFKDTVQVTSFTDPKVQGITIYLSHVQRPLIDRLKKEFFTEPSSSSICCCQSAPIRFLEPIALSSAGEEVFSERRNLFFKYVHVRRIYDAENNALVYVGYSSRLGVGGFEDQHAQYRTSITAISLAGQDIALPEY